MSVTPSTCPADRLPVAKWRLGRGASIWVAAGVVAHTLWTSAAPAMVYPLYAAEWGLSHATITAIFAIYPITVVAVLIGAGDISDHIGRRATMLLGLAASLAGVLVFALAPDVSWLFVGRALMGIGVGLSAGPSTAAMVEFMAPGQLNRASALTTCAQALGFGSALLIGGALIQYAPAPTRLPFWLLAVVITALLVATWFLPCDYRAGAGKWRPKLPAIPRGLRGPFITSAAAVTTAYTHGVLVLSLGAQVAHDLVGSPNAFVNGAALSLFALTSAILGIAGKALSPRLALGIGAGGSAAGMALLALAVERHDLAVFLAANAVAGAGYALLFRGGLELINAVTTMAHRGGVLSAVYLLAYTSLGIVALSLGAVATEWNLGLAIDLGAGFIALLSVLTLMLALA